MSVQRVTMPPMDNGQRPPNPVRWACDHGHVHPSHRHAVACNRRNRQPEPEQTPRKWREPRDWR